MTIFKNIVTDFGVSNSGVLSNIEWQNWQTFARAQTDPIELTMPAGTYEMDGLVDAASGEVMAPFDGIKNLTVNMMGATLNIINTLVFASSVGYPNFGNNTARVQTVNAGATSLTCVTASEAARFPVGRWCALGALEFQGDNGYPPNTHYMQYVQIVSADSGTGIVTFTPAATQTYRSTYPDNTESAYDCAGPATLYLLIQPSARSAQPADSWDATYVFNGGTVDNSRGSIGSVLITSNGRSLTMNNTSFVNCSPGVSINHDCTFNNVSVPDVEIEVDKDVEQFTANGGSYHTIHFQSSSVTNATIDGATFSVAILGAPRSLTVRNVTSPSLRIGITGYGNTEGVTVSDSTLSAVDGITTNRTPTANFNYSGTSLDYTGTGVLVFGVENSLLMLAGQKNGGSNFEQIGRPAIVTSVSNGASGKAKLGLRGMNTVTPAGTTGTVYVMQHPCRRVTFSNVTGCPEALDLSRAPAGKPLYSFFKRIDQNFLSAQLPTLWGYLQCIKINVTRAYTGAQSSAIFEASGQNLNTSDNFATFSFQVNTKIAGERIITPTSVTGAQSGDTLSAPGLIWFLSVVQLQTGANMSGDTDPQKPLITVEAFADVELGLENTVYDSTRRLYISACM